MISRLREDLVDARSCSWRTRPGLAGHRNADEADGLIVNTCAFIDSAKEIDPRPPRAQQGRSKSAPDKADAVAACSTLLAELAGTARRDAFID